MKGLPRAASFWLLLANTLCIALLGIINLTSAAGEAEGSLHWVQALWFGAGMVLAVVLAVLDYRILDRLAYPFFLCCLLALIAVLVFGREIKGGRRWLHLVIFNFQPSEMMKIAVILALAKWFNEEPELPRRGFTLPDLLNPVTPLYAVGAAGALILFWEKPWLAVLGSWRFALLGACLVWVAAAVLYALHSGHTRLHDLLSPVILVVLPAILIFRQPDLGTALVLFAIAASMILFMKVRWLSLLIAGVLLTALAVASWFFLLKGYQKERLLSFVSPASDTMGSGYHAHQSMIAVGSGLVSGKGYGESTQTLFKFLPEQHTDFVFSVWAEERGFVGCLVVVALFLALLVQVINLASSARDRFGVLVGVGMAGLIFWQAFINIGMVIGALPVVGITLPLWSYGGSSVLAVMMGVGLVVSVSVRRFAY
jgi:rod shape determining protein RodA